MAEDGKRSEEPLTRALRKRKHRSKSKSATDHDDYDAESAGPAGPAGPKGPLEEPERPGLDEISLLQNFCKWKATWKDFTEQCSSEASDIKARMKQLRDDLLLEMRHKRLSIVRIRSAADKPDDMPPFVRVVKSQSLRVINIDTIKEAIDSITIDMIRDKLSEGVPFATAAIQCIIDQVKSIVSTVKLSVQLSVSTERGTNPLDVPEADKKIESMAVNLFRTSKELKELAESKKRELEEIEDHLADLEPRIADVLHKQNWKTKRIRLETGVKEPREFILRERETVSKSSWKFKELQKILPELFADSLRSYDHWDGSFTDALKSMFETLWTERPPKTKKAVCLDRCAERWD